MKPFQPNVAYSQPLPRGSSRAGLLTTIAPATMQAMVAGMLLLGAPWLLSQTTLSQSTLTQTITNPDSKPPAKARSGKVAAIKSFRIVQEKDGPAVEILSTRPLVPAIQLIPDPDRLVIDLPNARLDTQQKRISVHADQISALRADQFQQNPPVARVVLDLLAPRAYTWNAVGNRLVVHLGRNPIDRSPFQPTSAPSLTPGPQPVVTAVRATGPLALPGVAGSEGSAITAGPETAVLRLSSGGEVHVCPGTTVSVTPSESRHNIMVSMNTGGLEAHFALDASSDSVMTPDFRILLVGPGEFHYAISADNQGNTCVRALPGNTASAIISELLGDRTYQVKATDQLLFHSGQLDRVDRNVPIECGCPPVGEPLLRAANDLSPQPRTQRDALPPVDPSPAPIAETAAVQSAPATGVPAAANPLDASIAPNQLHVQVEAPFVFHGTGAPPAPVEEVSALPIDSRQGSAPPLAGPLPPPANAKAKPTGEETTKANPTPPRGFFKKLGGFFSALFH